ncbi:MAG: glutamate racemase [Selenomonadaceae bacterium]|nr:glutamate racemase [Selenomonadaceae bacterium]
MKIAFFDSGIGGLSVLHHAMRILPDEEFIFFADEDNVPYGTKPRELVMKYVDDAFKFLLTLNVKAIVVACNTATSVAVKEMRRRYELPIIGMEPAIKRALDLYGDKRVLVTATPITINGEKIHSLIDRLGKRDIVDLLALPQLVDFAERQDFSSKKVADYLREQLKPYDFKEYSSLVLGCTHFNYFKDTMRKLLPDNVQFVDGNEGTLKELMRRLDLSPANSIENHKPKVEYYFSGRRVTSADELETINVYLNRLDDMFLL